MLYLFSFLNKCYNMETQDFIINGGSNKTFLSHIFDGSPEGNAEFMNIAQYSLTGIIPVVVLNKLIQNYIPDIDFEKSTLELSVEIALQVMIMFIGIVMIHRGVTYFPTYSGFKYEEVSFTSVVLAFLIIMLSVQTKLGMKVNILYERVLELWNGEPQPTKENMEQRKEINIPQRQMMQPEIDEDYHSGPPAPRSTSRSQQLEEKNIQQTPQLGSSLQGGPMAANSMVGGSFGSSF